MRSRQYIFSAAVVALSVIAAAPDARAIALGADFSADYSFTDLGSVSGLPTNYGGLVFKNSDTNTLLIGGAANTASGGLYEVAVTRDGSGHITGLGTANLVATAPYNDGGFAYGPGGVLFSSRWPVNGLQQYLPGSTTPDKIIDLAPFGVASSNAAINFVPTGFGGAGQLKAVSYGGGQFYTLEIAPDGSGTYDVLSATLEATIGGGPEGFVYIDDVNAGFLADSLLVSEYAAGSVGAYEIDANGNPIVSTRRDFLTELTGAEGAVIDPVTGDFLFSTFGGGNRIVVVQGFVAPPQPPASVSEPGTLAAFGLGLMALGFLRNRRTRSQVGAELGTTPRFKWQSES
jgi:hypothetical protein